jgi:subtilase family serine protease
MAKDNGEKLKVSILRDDMSKIQVKLAEVQKDVEFIKIEITEIKKKLDSIYVTQDEFDPVRKIVYGVVSLILVAVVGAIIALVIRR